MIPIKIKEDSKSLAKLIDAIRAGIGQLYQPIDVVRMAKAEAKANEISAESEAKITSLKERAYQREEFVRIRQQANIESVLLKAVSFLPENLVGSPVNEDWITHFFECVKGISDADMHLLWARILTGEVSQPGDYSPRTLSFLRTFTKKEAESFTDVCCQAWKIGESIFAIPFGSLVHAPLLNGKALQHLEAIGLVKQFGSDAMSPIRNGAELHYFDECFKFRRTSYTGPPAWAGFSYVFTQLGCELHKVAGAEPLSGFTEEALRVIMQSWHVELISAKGDI
ncbi:MAG: DUF2806 domain-containing protein [Chthoniobacteraceae bacterium]